MVITDVITMLLPGSHNSCLDEDIKMINIGKT